MDILKNLFPLSFVARQKQANSLVRSIIWYAAVLLVYFLAASLLGELLGNVAAWVMGLLGTGVGMYCTVGIVLAVLRYCGIIK